MTPRDYQISLLTVGRSFPLPALPGPILSIVIQAIGRVWSEVLAEVPAAAIRAMYERQLTMSVEAKLNNLRDDDDIWKSVCSAVVRGREALGANGPADELRADLSFVLTNRSANHPLVAECKIIERATNRTTAMYRDQGVMRFIDGRYAWWGREALMIAYVRDGSRIDTEIPTLFPETAVPWHVGDGVVRFRTSHARVYEQPNGDPGGIEPGEIALYHLWYAA